jgi:F0F1-type ATP synthase assembly protein I
MDQRPWWVTGVQFAGLGWYVAFAILAGTLAGRFLDRWAGTSPLFLLLGLLLGIFLAFYGTYRMVIRFMAGQDSPGKGKEK